MAQKSKPIMPDRKPPPQRARGLDYWLKEENRDALRGYAISTRNMPQLAAKLNITARTLFNWQKQSPEFAALIEAFREEADMNLLGATYAGALRGAPQDRELFWKYRIGRRETRAIEAEENEARQKHRKKNLEMTEEEVSAKIKDFYLTLLLDEDASVSERTNAAKQLAEILGLKSEATLNLKYSETGETASSQLLKALFEDNTAKGHNE